jgi:hypothetical protein
VELIAHNVEADPAFDRFDRLVERHPALPD